MGTPRIEAKNGTTSADVVVHLNVPEGQGISSPFVCRQKVPALQGTHEDWDEDGRVPLGHSEHDD